MKNPNTDAPTMAEFIRRAHAAGQTRDEVVDQVMKVYGKKNKQYMRTYYYQIVSGKRPQWQKRQAERRAAKAAPAGTTVDQMVAQADNQPQRKKYTRKPQPVEEFCNFCPKCGTNIRAMAIAMSVAKESVI